MSSLFCNLEKNVFPKFGPTFFQFYSRVPMTGVKMYTYICFCKNDVLFTYHVFLGDRTHASYQYVNLDLGGMSCNMYNKETFFMTRKL